MSSSGRGIRPFDRESGNGKSRSRSRRSRARCRSGCGRPPNLALQRTLTAAALCAIIAISAERVR